MKIADALRGVRKLGIDTLAFIYLVEQHPTYIARVRSIFQYVQSGSIRASGCVIALTEVLTLPLRNQKHGLVQSYQNILSNSADLSLIPVDSRVAEEAAELRALYNLKTPDALHVASAIQSGCDAFLTNDRNLTRVQKISVLIIDDLEL
jgi:predicted nucleic acid-binding protein